MRLSTQVVTGLKIILALCTFDFVFSCHGCRPLAASSCYLIFFSNSPASLNHTHLLSSQLSISSKLTALRQKTLVDLLSAPGSSGACLTCIVLERHLVLFRPSDVSYIHLTACVDQVTNDMYVLWL